MPVRTVVEEFCDVCFNENDRETVATDRLPFAWQGRDFLLLVCDQHVGPIRDELQRLSGLASPQTGSRRASSAARQPRATAARGPAKTLFSQLDDAEKGRFRKWASMPNARRISDSRVQEWSAAGRP
ncbi:MAG: hypothetical protein JWM85_3180 [Acidimicrobiaceae bacterium]|nr:hypothetical protein [Acidimicrobiaceae bacterium]